MSLTDACIRKPVLAWMLLLAVVLGGGLAWSRIGISSMPDVDLPVVAMQLVWPGAAPEVMEHDVVEPIEEAISQIEGIAHINSTARQGTATIQLELALDRSADDVKQEVSARIDEIRPLLPKDLEDPTVVKLNFDDFPILWISLSGPLSRQELADIARYTVKQRLQRIPGVGEIQWSGYVDRNVRLWFDRDRLAAFGLTAADVAAAIGREHVELPAGRIETGAREMDVRIMGEAFDLAELRALPVGGTPGAPVRLSDVALVEDGFDDVRSLARNSGAPAQALGVKKQRGTNAVAIARAVRDEMAAIQKELPASVQLQINYDDSRYVEHMAADLGAELVLAIILTALVCWIFLGSRTAAFNVLLSIPMSVLGAIAVIHLCGYTLNTFTMLALALVVGIVVDDAIMVQENIHRHLALGRSPMEAARRGTLEIRFAALAATAAVIAIVLPVFVLPGLIGKFFLQFGVALSAAVIFSYLEAVTLTPARCAQFLRPESAQAEEHALAGRAFRWLAHRYRRALIWPLRHPWQTLGATAAVFALSLAPLILPAALKWKPQLPFETQPPEDVSSVFMRFEAHAGTGLEVTSGLIAESERWVLARPEVLRTFTMIGGFGGTGTNSGVMFVTLRQPGSRALTQQQFEAVARVELNRIPGLKTTIQDLSSGPGGRNFTIENTLRGRDVAALQRTAAAWLDRMASSGLMVDLDTDSQPGKPELRILPDRDRCQDAGVAIADVAATCNLLIGGVKLGKMTQGIRRIDVRTRLRADQRALPDDLTALRVRARDGRLVPLGELVRIESRPAIDELQRKDRERVVSVYANVAPGRTTDEARAFMKTLEAGLPKDIQPVESAMEKNFRELGSAFGLAVLLGILFAYMILAGQFNSFWHPITVLVALIPALSGAFLGLWLSGMSLNTFSLIGIILLMGLVKKNSIILVDYANRERLAGRSIGVAMLRAGAIRLRPILMTTIATLAAALPVAIGLGAGTELRRPMAIAIFGGVLVSTIVSLFAVPALYVIGERLRDRIRRPRPLPPLGDATRHDDR